MIQRIGVIYQDRLSRGFLEGLRGRLRCEADLVEPPARIGISRDLSRREAKLAWLYFQRKGVDLIVRFTDADRARWQEVRRRELERVPNDAKSLWICGVAVDSVEGWLALDRTYLANALGVGETDIANRQNRVGVIKHAFAKLRNSVEWETDVVARFVGEAPSTVFRKWLEDDALRTFYTDCRSAAAREDCDTPNELGSDE